MKTIVLLPKPKFHSHLAPLGICYVISALRENGFDIELWEDQEEGGFEKRLLESKAECLVLPTAYKFHNNCPPPAIKQSLRFAEIAKKVNSKIHTVLIGSFTAVFSEQFLKNPNVDYIVIGEPELGTCDLLKALENKSDLSLVNGIGYKKGGEIKLTPPREFADLNKLPFPARDTLKMDNYIFDSYFSPRVTNIITSRGCPFNCTYCFGASGAVLPKSNAGRYYRTVNPERVIEELEYLIDKYKIKGIKFEDIEFCIDKERVRKICELMIEKGIKLKWRCVTRVTSMSPELLRTMKKAGCVSIYYGVESGNAMVLEKCNKKITKDLVRKVFKETHNAGIIADASFLFGLPEDTPETINETIEFAKELSPLVAAFHVFTPYKGTQLDTQQNVKTATMENLDAFDVYSSSDYSACTLSGTELQKYMKKAYRSFYFRPRYLLKATHFFFRNPRYVFKLVFGKKEGGWVRKLMIGSIKNK